MKITRKVDNFLEIDEPFLNRIKNSSDEKDKKNYRMILGEAYETIYEITFIKKTESQNIDEFEGIITATFGYNIKRDLYILFLWPYENPLDFQKVVAKSEIDLVKVLGQYNKSIDYWYTHIEDQFKPLIEDFKAIKENFLVYPNADIGPADTVLEYMKKMGKAA